MSRVIFLAPAQDPTTLTTFYGKDNQADMGDEAFVARLINDGKAAYAGARPRGIYVAPIGTTTATVNWVVDQPCTAMKVEYGTTPGLGSSQAATPASGQGAVTAALTGLTTGTLYYYRVSVTVGSAITALPPSTFRTL